MATYTVKTRPYTRADILGLNPDQHGVYWILNAHSCIYVGRGDIRNRMLDHLNGDNPCITSHMPTAWMAEVTGQSVARERELIHEMRPLCNKR